MQILGKRDQKPKPEPEPGRPWVPVKVRQMLATCKRLFAWVHQDVYFGDVLVFGVPESRTLVSVEMWKHSSRKRLGQSVDPRQLDDGGGQPGGGVW